MGQKEIQGGLQAQQQEQQQRSPSQDLRPADTKREQIMWEEIVCLMRNCVRKCQPAKQTHYEYPEFRYPDIR